MSYGRAFEPEALIWKLGCREGTRLYIADTFRSVHGHNVSSCLDLIVYGVRAVIS